MADENGRRLGKQRTTAREATDHGSGSNGPRLGKQRTTATTKNGSMALRDEEEDESGHREPDWRCPRSITTAADRSRGWQDVLVIGPCQYRYRSDLYGPCESTPM